jgi:hypothetical protein
MTIADFIKSLRMMPEVNDINEGRISNYQIFDALNYVLSAVFNTLAKMNSTVITKPAATLTLTANSVDLPSDFQSVVNVTDSSDTPLRLASKNEELSEKNYRIIGNKLYSVNSTVKLTYKYFYTRITSTATSFPLPDSFIEMAKDYTAIKLGAKPVPDGKSLIAMITDDVYDLTANRDYNELEMQMPFYV